MASLTLRVALLLVFAALLVVQCSSDSSEQLEEPSDEIKQLLSSPEMPSDEPSADRRKRNSVLAVKSKPPGHRPAPSTRPGGPPGK
ncbi:hypothetical protein GPALN_005100 [Globodera pallida]|uniref:Secreted protein n=1 Tax=Globodera pallida TaxID=36090 RepID=A0A183CN56_GLOPA|nr:hypothetical protein GPALN_005100 [Globodera pallida]